MKRGPRFAAYGWAISSTACALVARMLMDPVLGIRIPYATFYVAVAVSAVTGGLGPGIVAAVLGGLTAIYFFVPPRNTLFPLAVGADNQLGLALYVFVVAMLIVLAEGQRRANERAKAAMLQERNERQRFETTLSSIGDGVIATDADGRITFVNANAAGLTGWSVGEALGQPIESIFVIRNEETGAIAENPLTRAIREGRVVGLANHTVLLSRSGMRIPIDDIGAPIVDPQGRVTGAVLVFRDITGSREREAELRLRRRMIEVSHDAIILMDPERRITGWNRGAEEMYGWTEAEVKGKPTHSLLRTRDTVGNEAIDRILMQAGRWDGDMVHTRKDGTEIVTASRQVVLRDAEGHILGLLEINRDITETKRLETQLRRSLAEAEEGRRTLDAILEHLPEGLAVTDAPDGRVRRVSRCGTAILGQTAEVLVGRTSQELSFALGFHHPDQEARPAPEQLPFVRALLTGEVSTNEEWVIRRPDGTRVFALCDAAPIRSEDGRITGALVTWRDVTERKELEEKLHESAKLESLGVLAGGIAHDFNNLLTGVIGNASLLIDSVPERTAEWSYALGIMQAAERAAKLAHQMLAYSGRGRFVIERIDLSRYVRETADLIKSSIPKNVELIFDLAGDLPPVEADAAQLQQLVMNLVINGAEAVGTQGGRVRVSTAARTVDETYRRTLLLDDGIQPGTYVALEVSDDGCGMSEQILSRIFDPFFTTKFVGRGLGLSAVQGIVRAHKGAIKVYSRPGEGTTFLVLLPAEAAEAADIAEASASQPAGDSGTGTVLVIDDEEIIRSTARNALERLGYSVLTACDGSEGVEMFAAAKQRIPVVLLDLSMPGMSGEAVMRELRKLRPNVRIVLSSGFSEAEAMRRFAGQRLAGFLQKPYTMQALAQRIGGARSANSLDT